VVILNWFTNNHLRYRIFWLGSWYRDSFWILEYIFGPPGFEMVHWLLRVMN